MDIVMIGSGNTATVLGRMAFEAGHRILQVYSRQESHAKELASLLSTESSHSTHTLIKKADLFIFSLRDEFVGSFCSDLGKLEGISVHTAGAVSIEALRPTGNRYGVLYPLQSLRKEIEILPRLSLLVDGHDKGTTRDISIFAATLAETVLEADDETRLKYHLTAIVVNNFTNHLFTLAESFCNKENISFGVLQPLLEETVIRLRSTSPAKAQTGPAMRNDQVSIKRHEQLLMDYPSLLGFYKHFTEEIRKTYKHNT